MFTLLERLYADAGMLAVFSEERTVGGWLAAERALALAQGRVGVLSDAEAAAIARATCEPVDLERLWADTEVVGYPILPLVRQLGARLPPGPDGRVHYGATTQDIMDTGLALQLRDAHRRFEVLVVDLGDALARLAAEHRTTVLAARTHAQQAVPTTLGAKLAVYLDELGRHLDRLDAVRARCATVSLFGAGGTAAALGPEAAAIRTAMAAELGLADASVAWHVARDRLAEHVHLCSLLAGTAARLAREVVDLSRTEVAEVREASGHHRGASSTMPQKANPILAEAVIGAGAVVAGLASVAQRIMEAGHERAAGEWQTEWELVPRASVLAATCLAVSASLVRGLRVFPDAMTRNLAADGGLLMAEAHMMRLAPELGRERAHDLVYDAAESARAGEGGLAQLVAARAAAAGVAVPVDGLSASDHLGDAVGMCDGACAAWAGVAASRARP